MSSDVIIVTRDVAKRAEGFINQGQVTKGVELLLVENLYSDTCVSAGPTQSDCSILYKKGINILQNSPFDVLGIELGSKTVDVRKAYKKLALKYHPDKNPKTTPLFQVIQAASSKLSDATERSKEEQHAKKKSSVPSFPTAAPRPTNNYSNPNPAAANGAYPSASAYANSNAAGQGSGFGSAYPGQNSNSNKSNPAAGGGSYYNNNYYNNNSNYYQNYYGNNNNNNNNNYSNNAGNNNAGSNYGNYGNYSNNAGSNNNPYANYAYGNNSKANAGANQKPANSNASQNPYAQANAARKATNPADPSNNFRNDEAKRKNYYEDLLKEQYRKAAESDQRAREYAAKRAAEQRNEYDSYFKKQAQQPAGNSAAAGAGSGTSAKATEPPLSSFRPAPPTNNANNGFKPSVPSAFDWNYYANMNKEPTPSNPPSRVNSSHSMNTNNSGNTAQPSSNPTSNPPSNAYAGPGIGRTYTTTSDGKVHPQQQQNFPPASQPKVSPRPQPAPTASTSNPTKPSQPASKPEPAKPEPASTKVPSFSKKSIVPKPFGFRINSIASTMVELEWSTSQLHHVALGVELSWKEKTSTIWEMSEKLIRSGCCRKKNLNAGKIYEFRVRAVEELSSGAIGSKSDWSDTITANLPPAQSTSSSFTNIGTSNNANANKANASSASNNTSAADKASNNGTQASKNSNPKPAPTNAAPASASASASAAAETTDSKFQPHTPSKIDAIPQKFRRFNSKIKINNHQMEVEENTKTTPKDTKPKKDSKPIHPSIQKVLSSSKEAWGKETLQRHAQDDLHSLEVDEEVEDEEDDVLGRSKSDEEVADEEDEIAQSSEQVHTARPHVGKSPDIHLDIPPAPDSKNDKPKMSAASPAAAGLSYDSDSSVESNRKNKSKHANRPSKRGNDPLLSPVKSDHEDDEDDEPEDKKKSARKEDDDDEDNYSDDDFDVEEETHYQLVPPAQSNSTGKKMKNRGSKANLMEVLGKNGEEQYWHPVHQEPYPRAEVKGYVIVDRTIVACAAVGEWVRVKIHIMKDSENQMKKMKSYRKLDENNLNAKQKQDLWGWCLKKDKHHEYLRIMQFKRPLPTSSASKLPDPNADFKTPPNNRKSLGSTRNSFNNTSLFDLHIPVPTTANKENGRNRKEKDSNGTKESSTSSGNGMKKQSSSGNKSNAKITEWIECCDDMGNIYYYNEKTNESSWDPPDWIEEEDPTTGAKYYCHLVHLDNGEVSMNSTWTQPKEFARVIRASAM